MTTLENIKNPFRDPRKRHAFDLYITAWRRGLRGSLFLPNGERNRLSADRAAFWAGYDNAKYGTVCCYAGDPEQVTYPAYRAGQEAAKAQHQQEARNA